MRVVSCALFHTPQAIYFELQPLPCWIHKQHTCPAELYMIKPKKCFRCLWKQMWFCGIDDVLQINFYTLSEVYLSPPTLRLLFSLTLYKDIPSRKIHVSSRMVILIWWHHKVCPAWASFKKVSRYSGYSNGW